MYPGVIAEHDHSEEMVADASKQSVSTVAGSDNSQLPATTTELAGLIKSAIQRNDLATVNHLLDQGFDPNIRSVSGYTPLYWAVFGKLEDIVKTLLDHRADPNLHTPHSWQTTPFLLAAQLDNCKVVMLLLDRGADLNARDHSNRTALHLAILSSNNTAITEIQNCLLDRGAYINTLDFAGRTPLLVAVLQGSIAGIDNLLQGGANPDIPDKLGQTPLTKAVDYYFHFESKSMVNSLLANGANPNKPGKLGNTPLHLALQQDRQEIVDILLANGAHTNIPNASGKTALDIAAAKGVVDALHNYIPAYQPRKLMACARTCIRSRLVENRVPLAKALAPNSDCLPLPKSMKAYLYQPLILWEAVPKAGY